MPTYVELNAEENPKCQYYSNGKSWSSKEHATVYAAKHRDDHGVLPPYLEGGREGWFTNATQAGVPLRCVGVVVRTVTAHTDDQILVVKLHGTDREVGFAPYELVEVDADRYQALAVELVGYQPPCVRATSVEDKKRKDINGSPWTEAEDFKVLNWTNLTVKELAFRLYRTPASVKSRRQRLLQRGR